MKWMAETYLACWRHLLKLMACRLAAPKSTAEVGVADSNKSSAVAEKRKWRKLCYHHVSKNTGDKIQFEVPQDNLPTQLVQGRVNVCTKETHKDYE